MDEIADWYEGYMGGTAARHFLQGISETVQTLSHSPQIGRLDERRSTEAVKFYSFVAHPKYKIVYYFNSRSIYIVTIHRTLMKNG
ncbi:MAG: type II toxin-antitoxin system RelE/ParE family toxin [Bacteroidaceae bacterium]|nr:type II toxin-antitoxin system RelE/ParE family toxin [Bacteroidaceae bacterium]